MEYPITQKDRIDADYYKTSSGMSKLRSTMCLSVSSHNVYNDVIMRDSSKLS